MDTRPRQKTILVLGKSGTGKSSLCNLITGTRLFEAKNTINPVTKRFQRLSFDLGIAIGEIVDTVGFENGGLGERKALNEGLTSVKGFNLIFFVFKAGMRFKDEDVLIHRKLTKELLGDRFLAATFLVITHIDAIGITTSQKQIEWLAEARKDEKFDMLLKDFGYRVVFVANPPTSSIPVIENGYPAMREDSLLSLGKLIKDFDAPIFTIADAKRTQDAVDKEMSRAEEARKAALVRAATPIGPSGNGYKHGSGWIGGHNQFDHRVQQGEQISSIEAWLCDTSVNCYSDRYLQCIRVTFSNTKTGHSRAVTIGCPAETQEMTHAQRYAKRHGPAREGEKFSVSLQTGELIIGCKFGVTKKGYVDSLQLTTNDRLQPRIILGNPTSDHYEERVVDGCYIDGFHGIIFRWCAPGRGDVTPFPSRRILSLGLCYSTRARE